MNAVAQGRRDDGGPTGWLWLSPDDADRLAAKLTAAAQGVRAAQETGPQSAVEVPFPCTRAAADTTARNRHYPPPEIMRPAPDVAV
jgi:hypothetical protein